MGIIRRGRVDEIMRLAASLSCGDKLGIDVMAPGVVASVSAGLAYVLDEGDGQIPAAAGIIPMWQGVGHAWALFSLEVKRPRTFLQIDQMCRRLLPIMLSGRFWRVQATVIAGHAKSIEWAERLGMAYEGTHRKYGTDGADHMMFARVSDG